MEQEKNHGIFVFILVLFFLLFVGFLCYHKFYVEKKDDKKIVNLEDPKKEEDLIVDSHIYELMGKAIGGKYEEGFINVMDNRYNYDFDTIGKKKVTQFDTDLLSSLVYDYAYNNHLLKQDKNVYALTEENVKKIYSTIFGPYLSYKRIKQSTMCPTLSFDSSKKVYTYRTDCKETTDITKYNKITSVDENKDTIIVRERMAYYSSGLLENNVFSTYLDAINKKNSVGTIAESTEVQIENIKDFLSEYKYTFKKVEDTFYLYSVERIK